MQPGKYLMYQCVFIISLTSYFPDIPPFTAKKYTFVKYAWPSLTYLSNFKFYLNILKIWLGLYNSDTRTYFPL